MIHQDLKSKESRECSLERDALFLLANFYSFLIHRIICFSSETNKRKCERCKVQYYGNFFPLGLRKSRSNLVAKLFLNNATKILSQFEKWQKERHEKCSWNKLYVWCTKRVDYSVFFCNSGCSANGGSAPTVIHTCILKFEAQGFQKVMQPKFKSSLTSNWQNEVNFFHWKTRSRSSEFLSLNVDRKSLFHSLKKIKNI